MAIELLYVGFSCIKLTSPGGVKVLVDPWISGNPDCKMTVADLGPVDVLLVSHGAADHFGDTLEIMGRTEAKLYGSKDVVFYCTRKGVPANRLRAVPWGATIRHGDVEVRVVEAHHGSAMELDGMLISAMPLGFVIGFDAGEKIYFPGDTAIFGDLKLIGELHKPNIAMVGIGGVHGGVSEMTPEEAVLAAQWLGARTVMPIHYTPDSPFLPRFVDGLKATGLPFDVLVMRSGERRSLKTAGRI